MAGIVERWHDALYQTVQTIGRVGDERWVSKSDLEDLSDDVEEISKGEFEGLTEEEVREAWESAT